MKKIMFLMLLAFAGNAVAGQDRVGWEEGWHTWPVTTSDDPMKVDVDTKHAFAWVQPASAAAIYNWDRVVRGGQGLSCEYGEKSTKATGNDGEGHRTEASVLETTCRYKDGGFWTYTTSNFAPAFAGFKTVKISGKFSKQMGKEVVDSYRCRTKQADGHVAGYSVHFDDQYRKTSGGEGVITMELESAYMPGIRKDAFGGHPGQERVTSKPSDSSAGSNIMGR